MGFEDFFEDNHKHHHRGYDNKYDHNDYKNTQEMYPLDFKYQFLQKIKNNPKLRAMLIVAAAVIIAVIIILFIVLLPILIKIFHFISQNGIQGLLEALWKGSK